MRTTRAGLRRRRAEHAGWEHIEGSGDLFSTVLSQLTDPRDLARAAAVNTAWRDAITAHDDCWANACLAVPLLKAASASPWCDLAPRELLAQYAGCRRSRKDPLAIGPRTEPEHFRVIAHNAPVPKGCRRGAEGERSCF